MSSTADGPAAEPAPVAHRRVLGEAVPELLSRRGPAGHWRGRLSASALSTAVASFALGYAGGLRGSGGRHQALARGGLDWLAGNANHDGGFGDTTSSRSNLPTTTLCWATLCWATQCRATQCRATLCRASERHGADTALGTPEHAAARDRAGRWIEQRAGDLSPETLKRVIEDLYGEDKTFSVPILTLCALAGVLGSDEQAFCGAPALPFELAVLPHGLFRFLGLPVVSYALPALIAVGQVQHHRHPSRNPLVRRLRDLARRPTLAKLEHIQPSSGGFLEATPLTGFVTLSLAGAGHARHAVVDRAFSFFASSVRDDGSWPIDVDLATWVTTLSLQALAEHDGLDCLGPEGRQSLRRWLLDQQYKARHPFTGAAPGGWAWTDLAGGVPDGDDTPGALLALRNLASAPGSSLSREDRAAAMAGVTWLLDLQNRDGGLPTFCRGWGKLPFDRSSPDLTAHGLRAFHAWRSEIPGKLQKRVDRGALAALRYLEREQRDDGSWVPLWFGNEAAPDLENRVYGTSRVLAALADLSHYDGLLRSGARYLLAVQNEDGGWGGGAGVASSVEETALAVDALSRLPGDQAAAEAVRRGVAYLVSAWDRGGWRQASPIGFYFANLWYFEELYPLVFGVSALARAGRRLGTSVER